MTNVEIRLDYQGAISDPENIKRDFRKAIKIMGLSLLSSIVLTTGFFLIAFFLF